MKTALGLAGCVFGAVFAWSWSSAAQTPAAEGPTYSSSGQLVRPADYREWVYLTNGLGMTYGPAQAAAERPPLFDNVFVTREAHREFLRSGTWPDKTMFILEIRRADTNVSINNGGRTQGDVVAIEAAVKDLRRFPDGGWGYFTFDGTEGEVDLSDLAGRGVFQAWNDTTFFKSVRLASHGAIEWGSHSDICPDVMYLRLTGKSPEEIFPRLRSISADA